MPIRIRCRATWPHGPQVAETEGIIGGRAQAPTACYVVRNRRSASDADPPNQCWAEPETAGPESHSSQRRRGSARSAENGALPKRLVLP